ncbi:MAG: GWxTD domain-containing protein, partial [Ignavibacteriaceae bacterium]|nr:GWxTD domain-containing protein [Ignavibacteriaceae bacterium]
FHKKGNSFEAGLKLGIEITEQSTKKVLRNFKQHVASVSDFDLTNSSKDYIEGFLEFKVEKGNYELLPVFNDLNSNQELKIPPVLFNTDSIQIIIGNPLIINSEKYLCNDIEFHSLANFSSSIPFSNEKYSILIPVYDNAITNLNVEILSDKESVFNSNVSKYFESVFNLSLCDGRIVLSKENNIGTAKFFIISDISKNLKEGMAVLNVKIDSTIENKSTFQIPVKWINKPKSLIDPEKSIDYLLFIENSESVEELRKASGENLLRELFIFWKKYDPTPETIFNELMYEFYMRVDYAEINFRALASNNGAKSDRGRIYVQFGNPDSTERFTDEYGRMLETWKYSNPPRTFVFIDKKGNGNFTLINNQ